MPSYRIGNLRKFIKENIMNGIPNYGKPMSNDDIDKCYNDIMETAMRVQNKSSPVFTWKNIWNIVDNCQYNWSPK